MSLIGLKSIEIPDNVTVELNAGDIVVAKGPLGELTLNVNDGISVSINDGIIQVNRDKDEKQHRALHGLTRSLISNMIIGITEGYKKELNLVGVGYTVDSSNSDFLVLNLGFSHPIYFQKPDTIDFETPNNTTIIIKGINKQDVGDVAAKIREIRKPEPYKGKGIKYSDEHIRRKAGKTVGAPGAA